MEVVFNPVSILMFLSRNNFLFFFFFFAHCLLLTIPFKIKFSSLSILLNSLSLILHMKTAQNKIFRNFSKNEMTACMHRTHIIHTYTVQLALIHQYTRSPSLSLVSISIFPFLSVNSTAYKRCIYTHGTCK